MENKKQEINFSYFEKALKDKGFSLSSMSRLLGKSESWLSQQKMSGAVPVQELNIIKHIVDLDEDKLTSKFNGFDAEYADAILFELHEIRKLLMAMVAEKTDEASPKLKDASKTERASALLAKELNRQNGWVKEMDFKKILVDSGIGSSYMNDAIRNQKAEKVGHKGTNWIKRKGA